MDREREGEVDELFPKEEVTSPPEPAPRAVEEPPGRPGGSWGRGMISAVGAAIGYLAVPLAVVQLLTRVQPILTLQSGAEIAIIVMGALLVVAAFYAGYASENVKLGSIARVCETGLTALYLFLVLGRGPVLINLGSIIFALDITGYFVLLLIGTFLHGLSPGWDLVQYLRGKLE